MHQPIVRAGPDHVDVLLAGCQREHGAVDLGAVHVVRNGAARIFHGLRIVAAQIAADGLPGVAAVGRLPHALRAGVEHVRIDVGEDDRVGPLPAFLGVLRRFAGEEAGVGAHFLELAGAAVQACQERAVVGAAEEEIRVGGVRGNVTGLTAAHLVRGDRRVAAKALSGRVGVAWHAQRAVVLLRAADMEGQVGGRNHVVPLGGREVLVAPARDTGVDVEGDRAAAVVAIDNVVGVIGIDPQVVMIAVRVLADLHGGLAAVGGAEQRGVLHVDDVLVARVAEHVRVVERALPDGARRVDQLPRRAGIVRDEQAAILVLDQCVNPVGVGPGVSHADAADHARGHAGVAGDLGPRLAAVGRLVEAAAGSAARHLVLDAIRLPQRGVEHVRVVGIDDDVDGA